ncbi:uncharacterized protein LOC116957517 isoform X1 [Petromyzon marinus]|uniref:uncharacterized protein LOC116957517 isoform X1 n=1 Tax=Petromyzon marinus TaxID=7757 RepID=UPI003F6F1637
MSDELMSGWLRKSPSEKTLCRAWKRRWFVLKSGRLTGDSDRLEYFKGPRARCPLRCIPLRQCSALAWDPQRAPREGQRRPGAGGVPAVSAASQASPGEDVAAHERSGGTAVEPPSPLGFVFGLRTPERVYVLEADSAHEMHAWVKALRQLCGQPDGTKPADQSKSPSPAYSANAGQSGGSSHPRSGAISKSTSAIFPVPARSHAPSKGGHAPSPGHAHSLDQLYGAEQRLHPHRLRSQSQPSSALGVPPRSQGGSEGDDPTYLTPRTMSMPTQPRVAPLSSPPSLVGGTTLENTGPEEVADEVGGSYVFMRGNDYVPMCRGAPPTPWIPAGGPQPLHLHGERLPPQQQQQQLAMVDLVPGMMSLWKPPSMSLSPPPINRDLKPVRPGAQTRSGGASPGPQAEAPWSSPRSSEPTETQPPWDTEKDGYIPMSCMVTAASHVNYLDVDVEARGITNAPVGVLPPSPPSPLVLALCRVDYVTVDHERTLALQSTRHEWRHARDAL